MKNIILKIANSVDFYLALIENSMILLNKKIL